MKTKIQFLIIMLALLASLRQTIAQGTAFTYQGQLQNNGNPADDNYDLTFALFNSSSGAGQVGSTITYIGIGVSNGLFTVVLDFGANFPGADRWLEVGVRTNGGSGFTTLTPRQKLTPAPYAITAGSLNGVLPVAQLPGTVLTNHESGVTLTNLMLAGALNLSDTAAASDIVFSGSTLLLYDDNNGNFFSGLGAGNLTTSGQDNTSIGDEALANNMSGYQNTAVGFQALFYNTTGDGNTAVGLQALSANQSGMVNTAIGGGALSANTIGNFNTAIGEGALFENTSGSDNTASGLQTLFYNTTGSNNMANGYQALKNSTTASYNSANGYEAPFNNTTGSYNTANGPLALFYNTTGSQNTADGLGTLLYNMTGSYNTADGTYALYNSTGSGNIGLGYYSGYYLSTGNNNIEIGNAGDASDSGVIRIGDPEEQTTTYIAGNVGLDGALPQQTLSLNGGMNIDQSGQNAGLFNNGAGSGYGLSFGSGSGEGIASQRTGNGSALNGLSFYTSFGNRMTILNNGWVGINTTSPTEQLSVDGGANKAGGGSWDTFSDGRLKDIGSKFTHGLEAMAGIQPIHYHYKPDNSLRLPSQPEYVGVVAQQVQSAVPEAVHRDPGGYLVVNNDPIIWTMFNAIKELNQKRESEAKEKNAEIQTLKQQNDLLAERLNELEAKVEQLVAQK